MEKSANPEALPDHANTQESQDLIRKKCARFVDWCDKVGIKFPKVTYPDFFEGGLVGARVNEPIKHREAYLCVPYTAIISIDKCLKDPHMWQFYEENP